MTKIAKKFSPYDPKNSQILAKNSHIWSLYLRPLINTSINEPLGLDENSATAFSPLLKLNELSSNIDSGFLIDVVVAEEDSPAFKSQGAAFVNQVRDRLGILT